MTDEYKLHYFKGLILVEVIESFHTYIPNTCAVKTCAWSVPTLFSHRSLQGALASGLTHTNIIKPRLPGNKGHLVHQNTICHSNLDFEVSYETPNTGQGCVSEPSEGCKWVGICVGGERVVGALGGLFFILWPTAGERTYTSRLLWLIQIKSQRQ